MKLINHPPADRSGSALRRLLAHFSPQGGRFVLSWGICSLIFGLFLFVPGVSAQPAVSRRLDLAAARQLLAQKHRPGAYIARFRTIASASAAGTMNGFSAGRPISMRRIGNSDFHLLDSGVSDPATLSALSQHPDMLYVEPDFVVTASGDPNDTSFSQLWGLKNVGQSGGLFGADIEAVPAWDRTVGKRSVVVGVVDTGINYNHPDLAPNVWSAPRSFTVDLGGGIVVTCAAGTHGFNAISKSCDPLDDQGHGSHVAGTIGAAGNNASGVVGVNWVTSLIGLKFLSSTGSGYTSDAILAINFATQLKAQFPTEANIRVLNNSWGGGGSSLALLDAISKANAAEILFAAAAGNSGTNNMIMPSFPANYDLPNVISVAATDRSDLLASFSNYGTNVHLGAPGVAIYSTVLGTGYASYSGTSMATPHVSGAAALVLSVCSLTTSALRSLLLSTIDALPSLTGKTQTGGRLNIYKAISQCASGAPVFTVSPATANASATAGSASLAITSTPSGSAWTAVSSAAWLTAPPSGTATSLTYSYTANTTLSQRTATLQIGAAIFTLTQAPAVATITPASAVVTAASGSGSFAIATNPPAAAWTATSNAAWLTVPANGTATTLRYQFTANTTSQARTATVSVGSARFVLTQNAPTYRLTPATTQLAAVAGAGTLTVTSSPAGASWVATSNASWLTITNPNGTGTSVAYSYLANATGLARSATVTVGNAKAVLTQQPASFVLSPATVNIAAAAGTASVNVQATPAGATWQATSSASWLQVAASGSGTQIPFSFAANLTGLSRSATIRVASSTVTVIQAPATFTISPVAVNVVAAGGQYSFSVQSNPAGSTWTARSNASWLTLPTLQGNRSTVTYQVRANKTGAIRVGKITIGGSTLTVTQSR
jgi:subtilisin family serine protease